MGYSPWGRKGSNLTEQLTLSPSVSFHMLCYIMLYSVVNCSSVYRLSPGFRGRLLFSASSPASKCFQGGWPHQVASGSDCCGNRVVVSTHHPDGAAVSSSALLELPVLGLARVALVVKHRLQWRRWGFGPWAAKIPWRRAWQPTPALLPGESHGQRSPTDYSPQGHTESDVTEVTQRTRMPGTAGQRVSGRTFKALFVS